MKIIFVGGNIGNMENKYEHLLSPFKIGNVVFRNRLFTAPMGLHALQGGELYPTEAIIAHYANKAKGGAAVVTCSGTGAYSVTPDNDHLAYDIYIGHSQHYLAQLADAIHFYGAKASMEIASQYPDPTYGVVAGRPVFRMGGGPPKPGEEPKELTKELTAEMLEQVADNYAQQCVILKRLGFDMCMIHMAYDMGLAGQFLSPNINTRTDEFGGSLENRLRFVTMCFDRIHEKAGKDFLIELRMSGELPEGQGFTIDDACEMAKLLEGHCDLMHVHAPTGWQAHPMCFEGHQPNLWMAEKIKKSGTKMPIVTIGGLQDIDESEAIIAQGKADFVSMARGWLADPNLGVKAYEGKGEDVVPCIKCMRCHDSACIDGLTFVCTVNPVMGIEHNLERIDQPPARLKKIAIIGGGPAGMQAALTASGRGHDVTLYEMSPTLGGQLNFADYARFKFALAKYKNWLIEQVGKAPVRVLLRTHATRELLEKENYDAVIVAVGASPLVPPIPGADSILTAPQVYGHEDMLGGTVVVIGGGQVGCETALHLAQEGKDVTILEMQEKLAPDASASYRSRLIRNLDATENLKYILGGRCLSIGDAVIYADSEGAEIELPCDDVVMAAGMRSNQAAAMELYSPAYRLYTIGDCDKTANVQKAVRSAFATAVSI